MAYIKTNLSLIILIIISVISLGCLYKEEFFSGEGKFISNTEKGKFNSLEISMKLEKTVFKKGEKINILFILKNNGNDIVQLDDQGFDAGVYNSDRDFITYIRGDRVESKPINLGNDVSFIESLDWYQTYNEEDGTNEDLESGKYYIIGYLKADVTYKSGDSIRPYTIKTEPMMISIR